MNCSDASDMLIDLIYDELPPGPERTELEAHVTSCPTCQTELARLRFAHAAVAGAMAGEPAESTGKLEMDRLAAGLAPRSAAGTAAGEPSTRPPRRAAKRSIPIAWRWARRGAAAAAAAVVVFVVYVLTIQTPPPVVAEGGPPEIRRQGVSLTILSQPEGWVTSRRGGYDQQAAAQRRFVPQSDELVQTWEEQGEPDGQAPVQRMVNAPAFGYGPPVWLGLALVRDQRIVRGLPKGATEVAFTDVPRGILPDTVRLRSLDRPDGLTIIEQNYQYDLASASAVLKKYVDHPVTAVFKKGNELVSGTLLSFDARSLVIRPDGQGPRTITRRELEGIAFAKLPAGLLTRPTLLWRLENQAASQQQFEVAYLTHGLTWRADYVLKLHPGGGLAKGVGVAGGAKTQAAVAAADGAAIEDVTDTAELIGYATVNNLSGVTFEQAQLKLMAGDVNLIKPPTRESVDLGFMKFKRNRAEGEAAPAMTEKSFFEYHLYTVSRPTTIRSAETKQIEMVSGSGLKLRRGYVYDPAEGIAAPRVVSELMNSQANGLGKPLPKGVVRLYAPDPEGQETYVAATEIDHTPKDEKLRLPWGYAFDIACSAIEQSSRRRGADEEIGLHYQVRNHKDYGVNVTIIVRVPPAAYWAECKGYRWHVRQVGVVEIDVPVPANVLADVVFTYRHNDTSGGGLKSPPEEKQNANQPREGAAQ